MKKNNCTICNNKGWIESSILHSRYIPNGTKVIEKCDECNYFINDLVAAKVAAKSEKLNSFVCNGFNIKIDFHLN